MTILESKVNRGEAFERQAERCGRRPIEEIRDQEDRIRLGGGLKAQDKQRAQGKMTARERVEALCDPGSGFPGAGPLGGRGVLSGVWRRPRRPGW